MRALVQRVSEARVRVDGDVVGEIEHGVLALIGVTHDDTEAQAKKLADKIAKHEGRAHQRRPHHPLDRGLTGLRVSGSRFIMRIGLVGISRRGSGYAVASSDRPRRGVGQQCDGEHGIPEQVRCPRVAFT